MRAKYVCAGDFEEGYSIDCNHLQDVNCALFVPNGYFILPLDKGPYDGISTLYIVVLILWTVLGGWWFYNSHYKYKNQCMDICKLVSLFPALKIITTILSICFWSTCENWRICSFWLGVSLINFNLVYESTQVIVFLLIAKGWSIVRQAFFPGEWRSVVVTMILFYLLNAIILIIRNSVKNNDVFWSLSCAPYIIMYGYIIQCAYDSIKTINLQTAGVHIKLNHEIIKPIVGKIWMMYLFLLLVFIFFVLEIAVHIFFIEKNTGFASILIFFETSHLVMFIILGYIFRPQEHSAFFYLTTTVHNGNNGNNNNNNNSSSSSSSNSSSGSAIVPLVRVFDSHSRPSSYMIHSGSSGSGAGTGSGSGSGIVFYRDVEIECVPLLEKSVVGLKGNELDTIVVVKQSRTNISIATSL